MAKNDQGTSGLNPAQIEHATAALAKLPILGPAVWLAARDPAKKFMFLADIEWSLLPPVILDQCVLYSRGSLPLAFLSWALVSDAIHERLLSGTPKLAPHEWQSGEHVWLIDAISPFEAPDQFVKELRTTNLAGKSVNAVVPDQSATPGFRIEQWPPTG